MVPAAFVAFAGVLSLAGLRSASSRRLLALVLASYSASAVTAGLTAVRRRRESPAILPLVVAVFPAFHLGYGVGMVAGAARAAVLAALRRRVRF